MRAVRGGARWVLTFISSLTANTLIVIICCGSQNKTSACAHRHWTVSTWHQGTRCGCARARTPRDCGGGRASCRGRRRVRAAPRLLAGAAAATPRRRLCLLPPIGYVNVFVARRHRRPTEKLLLTELIVSLYCVRVSRTHNKISRTGSGRDVSHSNYGENFWLKTAALSIIIAIPHLHILAVKQANCGKCRLQPLATRYVWREYFLLLVGSERLEIAT